jgi:hypothetical protein
MSAADALSPQQFFHGTSAEVEPGGLLSPGHPGHYVRRMKNVYMTTDMGHAQTYAFNASTQPEHQPHVYQVEPTGDYGHRRDAKGNEFASEEPLRVVREVWRHPDTIGEIHAKSKSGFPY